MMKSCWCYLMPPCWNSNLPRRKSCTDEGRQLQRSERRKGSRRTWRRTKKPTKKLLRKQLGR